MKRIHWHWTAGAPGINPKEADSYNFVVTWPDGEVIECVPIERQIPPLVNGAYAAHTKGANSWAIGIAVDAMAGAQERPFNAGKHPITQKQVDALVKLSRDLGHKYGIPVTRQTMLSHAEVQKTLGIKQNQKWDIMWLPGMDEPGDAVHVGDSLRAMIRDTKQKGAAMSAQNLFSEDFEPDHVARVVSVSPAHPVPTLRKGSKGEAVRALQIRLRQLNYFSGAVDGKYGTRTMGAVIEFQSDHDLEEDGIYGRQTRDALATALPRAPREVTKADLEDSRTMQTAKDGKRDVTVLATVGTVSTAVAAAEQARDVVERAGGLAEGLMSASPWLIAAVVVVIVSVFAYRKFTKVEDIRLDDARTGANISR